MEKINTLVGGMHSDNEPAFQPENTYREGRNGILTAKGSNRYSFEYANGTVVSFTIPLHGTNQNRFEIIGWTSFVDKLIVLLANDEASQPGINDKYPGEIGKVVFDNSGTGTYTPLYYHKDLNFSKDYPIAHDAIISKPETQNTERVVWTDNRNPMRGINILDRRLTNYISSGSLVNGTKYMVLTTASNSYVTYGGNDYGPDQVNGNVFTATATTTYTTTGTCLVIEYIPVELLDSVPKFKMGNIIFKGLVTGGSLQTASYQYFYQLESEDGARTVFSYITLPIRHVSVVVPDDSSTSYARTYSRSGNTNTTKAIKITIDGVDTNYKKIRVGFIKTVGTAIDVPKIFSYVNITGSSMDFTHFGSESNENLVFDDLIATNSSLDKVRSITSSKNILFAGNIGLTPDKDLTIHNTVQLKAIVNEMVSDLNGTNVGTVASAKALFGHGRLQSAAVGNGFAHPGMWHEVIGDVSNKITYNGLDYYPGGVNGAYFKGIGGTTAWTTTGSPKVVIVNRIRMYGSTYRYTRVENDFGDHKGAFMTHHSMSYWRGQKYRFGILFYDTKGNPKFVRWLGDKDMPEQYNTIGQTEVLNSISGTTGTYGINGSLVDWYSGNNHVVARALGIEVNNLDFVAIMSSYGVSTLAELKKIIGGFSIVRSELDGTIVAQGTIWAVMKNGSGPHKVQSVKRIDKDFYYDPLDTYLGRLPNFYSFHSPRKSVTIKEGDYLKIVNQYGDLIADPEGTGIVTNYHYMYKFVDETAAAGTYYAPGSEAKIDIQIVSNVDFGTGGNNVGQNYIVDNWGKTNSAFVGGIRDCRGAPCTILRVFANESLYPLGFGRFASTDTHKSVVNWIRPKDLFYGGTSESALSKTNYIFCGHYQAFDDDFISYLSGNSNIANGIQVFGGDVFVGLHGEARMVKNTGGSTSQVALGQIIPFEAEFNELWRGALTTERMFNKDRTYHISDAPNGVSFSSRPEATNIEGWASDRERQNILDPAPLNFISQDRDNHLVVYSNSKVDGEVIDNWRRFPINNFLRVDGQYGSIINIRAKGSRLFYWQEKGVGYIPIQERSLQSSSIGDAIQLGVGGVAERFDELDFFYGNQHQMSLMESDSNFAWFDFRRRTVMRLGFGGDKVNYSIVNGLNAFFQTLFEDVESESGTTIFDTDNPLRGKGIISYYDQRYNLGLMTFKYYKTSGVKKIEKDFTIAFDKYIDKYVGFFDFSPNHYINHNGLMLATRNARETIKANTSYSVGDEVVQYVAAAGGRNFVCILAFTTGGATTHPSVDTTHWAPTANINDVSRLWRGNTGQFFGVVKPYKLTVILKGEGLEPASFDNLEVAGNDTVFTDVETTNGNGFANDNDITTTNKNYRYFDGSWFFNLPLKNKRSRLVDHYIQVTMKLKNYSGNAINTSLNLIKRVFFVKQSNRLKR